MGAARRDHTEERLNRLCVMTSGWPSPGGRVHRLHGELGDPDGVLRRPARTRTPVARGRIPGLGRRVQGRLVRCGERSERRDGPDRGRGRGPSGSRLSRRPSGLRPRRIAAAAGAAAGRLRGTGDVTRTMVGDCVVQSRYRVRAEGAPERSWPGRGRGRRRPGRRRRSVRAPSARPTPRRPYARETTSPKAGASCRPPMAGQGVQPLLAARLGRSMEEQGRRSDPPGRSQDPWASNRLAIGRARAIGLIDASSLGEVEYPRRDCGRWSVLSRVQVRGCQP